MVNMLPNMRRLENVFFLENILQKNMQKIYKISKFPVKFALPDIKIMLKLKKRDDCNNCAHQLKKKSIKKKKSAKEIK